ncbi:MarR family winged helix-turn-helix transcriptional regulator [Paenibacillus doosanensis]|nr:MarR family transcriptional regulator [Paenibacillus doosanensis]
MNTRMQQQFQSGITREQMYLLKIIADEQPCKITELAKRFGLNPSTISTMVNRMEKEGFISREYGNNDRRNVFVSITPHGQDVLKQNLQHYSGMLKHYLSHLERSEVEAFVQTIEKIASIDDK